MGTGSSSIALTEMGDLHHEVTVKCAAASIAGNQVFSLIKPVSLKERPKERSVSAIFRAGDSAGSGPGDSAGSGPSRRVGANRHTYQQKVIRLSVR